MFRDLTRKKQKLSTDACKDVLKRELRGVLAVNGDGGYPYAFPINFYFDEENNRIYFHSGKTGHKLDAIAASDKVSFCVYDQGYRENGHWSLYIKSVIVFGRIHAAQDWSDRLMENFCKRFTSDMDYIHSEIEKFRSSTVVLCLEIEHITGQLVNEA
ncbi:MAG: pyridoxamine 5'-phosphate oxidase family protein [Clostridia bacterium]|nr:pyridoxamine 5'-phosphate oxidase family protein [Clostridia bacterium]